MKRLWRWIFNGVTIVSLLLCLGAGEMWRRSYTVAHRFMWVNAERNRMRWAAADHGFLYVCAANQDVGPDVWHDTGWTHNQFPPHHEDWSYWDSRPPFYVFRSPLGLPEYYIIIAIPFWLIVSVTTLLPLSRTAWRVLRRRRHPPGRCRKCGYDMRATPQRCPECGTAAEST